MVYTRKIEREILNNLSNKRALFILGSRRVGKTTLMQKVREQINDEKTLFFDLERDTDIELFKLGIDNFISYLDTKGISNRERVVIFIDEIQYLDEFSNFVKLAVDHYSHRIKLILSGSSAAQIKYQFRDSLVGRKFIFELQPLTFREFLLFKEEPNLMRLLGENYKTVDPNISKFYDADIRKLYLEYLIYGGYPEVALVNSFEEKRLLLREIIQAYVLKDIRNLFTIEKIDEFNRLIRLLSLQTGGLLSIQSLAKESNLDMRTLKRYLQILKDTFIIDFLPPLFTNKRKELKKMSKVYITDTGIRNALIDNFITWEHRIDKGELLETQCFMALKKDDFALQQLYFWRTQDGKEVDFVRFQNGEYIPFEVKIKGSAVNHLKYFKELYGSSEINLIMLEPQSNIFSKDINVIPAWFL